LKLLHHYTEWSPLLWRIRSLISLRLLPRLIMDLNPSVIHSKELDSNFHCCFALAVLEVF